ncbi:MAG: hypothetical protein E4H01_10475 [Lysobacterales bacterium]|nr:MAG: hypothetical protein E4H01_10475 [Xanthomonadales bacterium]
MVIRAEMEKDTDMGTDMNPGMIMDTAASVEDVTAIRMAMTMVTTMTAAVVVTEIIGGITRRPS